MSVFLSIYLSIIIHIYKAHIIHNATRQQMIRLGICITLGVCHQSPMAKCHYHKHIRDMRHSHRLFVQPSHRYNCCLYHICYYIDKKQTLALCAICNKHIYAESSKHKRDRYTICRPVETHMPSTTTFSI